MKVLVISQTYCERNSRAKFRKIVNFFHEVQVKVLTPKDWPDTLSCVVSKPEEQIVDNISKFCVVPKNTIFNGKEIYHLYKGLIKEIKFFEPDIVQVETGGNSLALFQVLLIKKFFKLKFKVLFFSWVNWIPRYGWKYRVFYRWIENFNLRGVDGAVLGNKDAQDLLLLNNKFIGGTKVIPQLGTDSEVFHCVDDKSFFKETFGLNKDDIVIGFAGRFVEEKGISDLIQAFNILKIEGVKLLLAGSGNYFDFLKNLVTRYNLEEKVIFIGSLDHSEMAGFFKVLDVFVLPSFNVECWKEQFGQVLVQAMLSKVSVIGSDAGEIPNVIADSGLIFKQRNVEELVRCLKKLISDKKFRDEMAQKGFERAKENYSHEAIAKQTYDFWREILEN